VRRELKAERKRESLGIALDLLVEMPGFYAVEFREVTVENDSLPAQNKYLRVDFSCGHDRCLRRILSLVSLQRGKISGRIPAVRYGRTMKDYDW
jgi:hypothetical protein